MNGIYGIVTAYERLLPDAVSALNQTTQDPYARLPEYAGTDACALTSVCQWHVVQLRGYPKSKNFVNIWQSWILPHFHGGLANDCFDSRTLSDGPNR